MIRAARHAGCRLIPALAAAALVAAESGRPDEAVRREQTAAARDAARDFDFEFGEWDVRLSRLADPLSGSTKWLEYEGTSVVRRIWKGRANLGELEVSGASGRIEGLSLRLYNPETRLWSIRWANSRDGDLGPPMIGRFDDGVGRFYNQEMFGGRAVFVRFLFTEITRASFRLEQAFSADGGATWEANWIATFARRETREVRSTGSQEIRRSGD